MANGVETTVAQVGLRDFLFYVLPGSVWLVGILAFKGARPVELQPYMGLSSSVAAVLAAYLLGQFGYPLSYGLRRMMRHCHGLRELANGDRREVRLAYRRVLLKEPMYFSVEIFRYRTMARFSVAMMFPVLFAAAGIACGDWLRGWTARISVLAVGMVVATGFAYRYCRYEHRYVAALADEVTRAEEASSAQTQASFEVAR